MTDFEVLRKREHAKYERAYAQPNYRMKAERRADAVSYLEGLPVRGGYLDASCGQGDMLDEAARLGFDPVQGTEIVKQLLDGERIVYAEVHALPFADNSFEVATLFDVIEHLLPGDDERACRELARVARSHVVLTANNKPSFNKAGDDLHINRRLYEKWDELFKAWFPGRVRWFKGPRQYISEAWRIDLA